MSVFEDRIKKNKSSFDNKEPEYGHQARFIEKLDKSFPDSSKSGFPLSLLYRTAAIIILLVTVGYFTFTFLSNTNSNEGIVNSIEYSQDMNEILTYYDAISLEKVNEIDKLVPDNDKAKLLKQDAVNRLDDIDGSLAEIEKEFAKNPDNENIKSALINNKRKKVEVMDNILIQLDFANSSLF